MLASFFIGGEIGFQKIGEKEDFQNDKHDEKFDKDDNPHLATPITHVFKTPDIKSPDT